LDKIIENVMVYWEYISGNRRMARYIVEQYEHDGDY